MTTKGIIFSAPMVRALLAGTKTQTRRLLRNPEYYGCPTGDCPHETQAECDKAMAALTAKEANGYAIGDRLYVREGWAVKRCEPCLDHERDWQSLHGPTVRYLADGAEIEHRGYRSTGRGIYHGPVRKGRPSIHMPRWASRLWLEVTEVRVERLQSISEADAIAEGTRCHICGNGAVDGTSEHDCGCFHSRAQAIPSYQVLWNTLHTEPGLRWEDNPWIVAVSFAVHHGNIDEVSHG